MTAIVQLLLPPLGFVWAALAGLWLPWRRAGRSVVGLALAGLLVLAMPYASRSLLVALQRDLPLRPSPEAPPGAVVILGGDAALVTTDRAPVGLLTLERVRAGVDLARRTGLPILVTGGVITEDGPSIAQMMARVLAEEYGLPARWVESHSATTWENALYSAPLLQEAGIHSAYVVSQPWHLKRAAIAFRRTGVHMVAAPTALEQEPPVYPSMFAPRISAWMQSYYALHEWVGCVAYALRG